MADERTRGFLHVGDPLVTFNSRRPDWITVNVPTLEGRFDFRLDVRQAELLRERLETALGYAQVFIEKDGG